MKTLKPFIFIYLVLQLCYIGCGSQNSNQLSKLQLELEEKNKLLANITSAYQEELGFALTNTTSDKYIIRVTYSYKEGYEADELLTIPPKFTEFLHQSFLRHCNDGEPSKINFFLVIDINDPKKDEELKIGSPITKPSSSPGVNNTIELKKKQLPFCYSPNINSTEANLATKTVYTVVMDWSSTFLFIYKLINDK